MPECVEVRAMVSRDLVADAGLVQLLDYAAWRCHEKAEQEGVTMLEKTGRATLDDVCSGYCRLTVRFRVQR